MAEPPNVVLVVLDTARAMDVYDPSVAPTIADLADDGTRVNRAISAAPWTLPSHASMFTGTYPSKHGAHADHEFLDDALPTLADCFRSAGYETVGVSNNTWVSRESGFGRGFDTFRQMWQLVQTSTAMGELVDVTEAHRIAAVTRKLVAGNPLANVANVCYRLISSRRSDDGAERSTRWIVEWLEEREQTRPFFLFANYLEPHLEYSPPRRLAEHHVPLEYSVEEAMDVPQRPWEYLAGTVSLTDTDFELLRGLYRAEIAYLDEHLARLKRALVEAGVWDDTIFVVTADHGENVGDHALMDHQYCLYDTLVHVPLVLHGGAFTDGEAVEELVSLVDLAPTLLDAARVDAGPARREHQGASFHPDAERTERTAVISEYLAPQPSMDALQRHLGYLPGYVYEYDRSLRAIRTTDNKLIRGSDGTVELYDLVIDPDESRNISSSERDVVETLSAELDEWLDSFEHARNEGGLEISRERRAHLENLGYIR